MNKEMEAEDIIKDMQDVGFLTVPEIREMLVMGKKNKKTSKRIEAIIALIIKSDDYKEMCIDNGYEYTEDCE